MKWKGFRPAYMIRQELHLTIWQRIKRVFFISTLFLFYILWIIFLDITVTP